MARYVMVFILNPYPYKIEGCLLKRVVSQSPDTVRLLVHVAACVNYKGSKAACNEFLSSALSLCVNTNSSGEIRARAFHHLFEFVCAQQPFKLRLPGLFSLRCLNTILPAIAVVSPDKSTLGNTEKRDVRLPHFKCGLVLITSCVLFFVLFFEREETPADNLPLCENFKNRKP